MDERSVRFWRVVLLGIFGAPVAGAVLLYAVDTALLSTRSEPFGTVTRYAATRLKNGQTEIYYNNAIERRCVHALFPHRGLAPCWYLRRSELERIG
jgi:hypothetical protein